MGHSILCFKPIWWLSCFQMAALKRHIVSHALLLPLQPGHAGSWRCLLTAPNKCCQKALPKCEMIFFWRKKTWVIRTGFQKQQALGYFFFFFVPQEMFNWKGQSSEVAVWSLGFFFFFLDFQTLKDEIRIQISGIHIISVTLGRWHETNCNVRELRCIFSVTLMY